MSVGTTRAVRLLLVLLAALAVLAAPAQAQSLLEEGDRNELANALAEATEDQDVCYGWDVDISDGASGTEGSDVGSNFGPGSIEQLLSCERYAYLSARVTWTSESSESEDSSSANVQSSLPNPPTIDELQKLTGANAGDLKDEDGDRKLTDLVSALPLVVADHRTAPSVPFEPGTSTVAAGDGPTNRPGSDVIRSRWPLLVLCGLVVVGGLLWLLDQRTGMVGAMSRAAAEANKKS